jgi:cobalamin biosynthesis Mg chelatase CobN
MLVGWWCVWGQADAHLKVIDEVLERHGTLHLESIPQRPLCLAVVLGHGARNGFGEAKEREREVDKPVLESFNLLRAPHQLVPVVVMECVDEWCVVVVVSDNCNRNCNAAQCNATRRDVAQRNATQRNATQRNATQRNATQRNATQRNATQRNATQCNATQCNCDGNGNGKATAMATHSSSATSPATRAVVVAIAGMIFPAMILASCLLAGLMS